MVLFWVFSFVIFHTGESISFVRMDEWNTQTRIQSW